MRIQKVAMNLLYTKASQFWTYYHEHHLIVNVKWKLISQSQRRRILYQKIFNFKIGLIQLDMKFIYFVAHNIKVLMNCNIKLLCNICINKYLYIAYNTLQIHIYSDICLFLHKVAIKKNSIYTNKKFMYMYPGTQYSYIPKCQIDNSMS